MRSYITYQPTVDSINSECTTFNKWLITKYLHPSKQGCSLERAAKLENEGETMCIQK